MKRTPEVETFAGAAGALLPPSGRSTTVSTISCHSHGFVVAQTSSDHLRWCDLIYGSPLQLPADATHEKMPF
jgi:hypothetical protein